MVLCNIFSSALVGASSVSVILPCWSKNNRQNLSKNRDTPCILSVFQGLLSSNGPKNISYMRKQSAPYLATTSSGLTTLCFDLDIFSTAAPHIYFPSGFRTNSALAYSGFHCLKAAVSNTSFCTILISTCSSVVLYGSLRSADTNVLVPLMR